MMKKIVLSVLFLVLQIGLQSCGKKESTSHKAPPPINCEVKNDFDIAITIQYLNQSNTVVATSTIDPGKSENDKTNISLVKILTQDKGFDELIYDEYITKYLIATDPHGNKIKVFVKHPIQTADGFIQQITIDDQQALLK